MTGGIGFTKLAQTNYRNNRNLLKKTYELAKENKPFYFVNKYILLKKSSPKRLQALREKLRRENHKQTIRKWIVGAVLLGILLSFFLFLIQ